jgi:hypothetical protein
MLKILVCLQQTEEGVIMLLRTKRLILRFKEIFSQSNNDRSQTFHERWCGIRSSATENSPIPLLTLVKFTITFADESQTI